MTEQTVTSNANTILSVDDINNNNIDSTKIYHVAVDLIQVPDVRITSVFDAVTEQEFIDSIKVHGIKEPLSVKLIDNKLVLVDGLHRLLTAKHLNYRTVPCRIEKGDLGTVLIENVITARQRGRENAAQTAEVVRALIDDLHYDFKVVQRLLSLSETYCRRLYKVASLADEIKDYIKQGKISVTAAYHLTNLTRVEDQLQVARDAAIWGYTEEQVKARVAAVLNPDQTDEQAYTFTPAGKPEVVLPKCFICREEIKGIAVYKWFHDSCIANLESTLQSSEDGKVQAS
ncbi:MAG: ParB/RepB/Spo0J family partition protein [Candidatus Nitrosocaldus sp.]